MALDRFEKAPGIEPFHEDHRATGEKRLEARGKGRGMVEGARDQGDAACLVEGRAILAVVDGLSAGKDQLGEAGAAPGSQRPLMGGNLFGQGIP